MKNLAKFITILTFAFAAQIASAQWVEGSVIGVRSDSSKDPGGIFVNSVVPIGPSQGVWHRLTVAELGIPSDAKSVFLSGALLITHGYNPEQCDLNVSFRAPGNNLDYRNSIGQTIEPFVGGGQRSNMATWVPVKNGEIEFYWWHNTTNGTWPAWCAYGINLIAQAYLR